jgi:hypothetical protein
VPKYRNSRDEIELGLAEIDETAFVAWEDSFSRTAFLLEANALPEGFGAGYIRVVVDDNLTDDEIAEYGSALSFRRSLQVLNFSEISQVVVSFTNCDFTESDFAEIQRYIADHFSRSEGCAMFSAAIAGSVDLPWDDITRDPGAWFCGVQVLPPCNPWWQSLDALQFYTCLALSILEVS